MTIQNKEHTVLGDVKSKLKSIDYNILIDKNFTSQNLMIIGGIFLFFILLVTMIVTIRMTSANSSNMEVSKFELIEKNMIDVSQQQASMQLKINKILNYFSYNKSITDLSDIDIENLMAAEQISENNTDIVPEQHETALPDLLAEHMDEIDSGGIETNSNVTIKNIDNLLPAVQLTDSKSDSKKKLTHNKTEQVITYRSKKESEFETQMLDIDWKTSAELKIIDALEQTKYDKTWFDNLKCKSSICKLEVSHINKLDSDRFVKDFPLDLLDFNGEALVDKNASGKYVCHLFLQDNRNKIIAKSDDINKEVDSTKKSKEKSKKIKISIQQKFIQENIDNRWRKLIEFKIMTILDKNKFKRTWFDQLLCKTSVCKLVVTHKKRKYSNKFITQFPSSLGEFEKKKALINKNKNGNYKTTMYLQQHIEKTKQATN